jgi:tetratricopeptide (TPR) repeat protein
MLFQAYNNLSYIYNVLKQYEEAVEVSKQAIRLDSNSYLTYYNLGLAYYGLKQYRDAINSFQKAITLNVSESPTYKIGSIYSLGMTYLALGDKNSALEQQKLLTNLDPEKAKELLSKLSNMSGNWRTVTVKGDSDPTIVDKIVDDGVKITSQSIYKGKLGVTCEGKWEGNYAFGISPDGTLICAYKKIDSTQLIYTNFPRNFNDSIEKAFNYARERIDKTRYSMRKIE